MATDSPLTRSRNAWGKSAAGGAETHHLAHHCADVAAVLIALLREPHWRARANAALGRELTDAETVCLGALAFLHDIGKLAPGFQAKAWPEGHGLLLRGHLECGWLWTNLPRPDALAGAAAQLFRGAETRPEEWLAAIFSHHGQPVQMPENGLARKAFPALDGYDWEAEEAVLGQALLAWFPEIRSNSLPPAEPAFLHFFAGLLTLADWVGSDRSAFPFVPEFTPGYWELAQARAAGRVAEIELGASPALRGPAGWGMISDHPSPRPAQEAVGRLPVSERLVLLESETGSGKTEAALWRLSALLEAGEVDALYFAVPTRAAARQIHGRINDALKRMFKEPPEAVLAIPGQAIAGEVRGRRLPDFKYLWDDGLSKPARWAAEHSARYLAARVAVGTVDQMALGGLQVKFAHLRGAALSRALLVIDEVHASDPYMTETQLAMVESHLALGGHVLLMSATLGAAARRRWRREAPADLASDSNLPYPAVWTSCGLQPIAAEPESGKSVSVRSHDGWSAREAANLALDAARRGARILVIRNTVSRAQETFNACRAVAPELLLAVNGIPTLHHSRFAAEDRALLDHAVEAAIGKDSPLGGRVVIGTQTLEQSLDLCADILITDLCPMDVLLQRIGRLHRHKRPRPEGFSEPQCIVLCPEDGLDALTRRAENGLGAYPGGPDLSGIYVDVPGLQATLDQIQTHPRWEIPRMNRQLVEAATHPDALDLLAEARGWQSYRQSVMGKATAEMQTAGLRLLDRSAPMVSPGGRVNCFPADEDIRTRLGEQGAIIELPSGTIGVFGAPIRRLALPALWSRGLTGEEVAEVFRTPEMMISVLDKAFTYGPEGLQRKGSDNA
ncbi:CRISPR-associated helicase Cas3' [Paracoccus litorisediminis]|uniref:CRISPR-associated helicase Cas3 n=1 Tax=Paracoccus litorisediminis TaxID=2006130 RepID=A0A844HQ74_9RHOB|nr:CRISPR-associated helicase Cas3' [Paracoccus litorisediminis]MTH62543.1 CRISPR-associated helicase Cas3' [Paracoccus litorisediminis]